jgi:hypothetical protein
VQAWENRINAVAGDYADRGVAVVAIYANDADAFHEESFDEIAKRAEGRSFAFRLPPRRGAAPGARARRDPYARGVRVRPRPTARLSGNRRR